MKLVRLLLLLISLTLVIILLSRFLKKEIKLDSNPLISGSTKELLEVSQSQESLSTPPSKVVINVPDSYEIPQKAQVFQTFNNCGPATLSMALSYYGVSVGQKELGDKMRPYQNPKGDNDDKAIFTYEFVNWAKVYGKPEDLDAITLPNGNIELLKRLISNDIPVIIKMWLNSKEDIGHFVLARGYDENKKIIIMDDTYYGPNRKISYSDVLSLWQPFNYNYVIIYNKSQESLVSSILSNENDQVKVWKNTVTKAHEENELAPENIYPVFNLSVGYYNLGDMEKSIKYFEQVESRLPKRMLWYQIEPIKAYAETGNYSRALELIENILNNGNRAFSELYYLRGQIYLKQNEVQSAKLEFEKAVQYNINYQLAKDALINLQIKDQQTSN
jgi:hypothetical protein